MADRVEVEEGFLGRWARLKRDARTEAPVAEQAVGNEAIAAVPEPVREAPAALPAETGEEAPDLSDLPSLDSLDAGSDYTGFLRPDVPAELRRQALRKAWASDPAIAGFRGFAEYDWDYNAPGYGALRPTDDIARLLDAVLPDDTRREIAEETGDVADAGKEQADITTCPHPGPAPLGEERSESLSGKVASAPPPREGGAVEA
ncbi:DUF3306 domain-containing protein [Azospirillum sp. 412522]|nr:DUF3306 domain-containing protein [Azospirillum sp. 412522]MBY6261978.1 DUF3306 domain-containing protein [Azospirillum sp. 412522]